MKEIKVDKNGKIQHGNERRRRDEMRIKEEIKNTDNLIICVNAKRTKVIGLAGGDTVDVFLSETFEPFLPYLCHSCRGQRMVTGPYEGCRVRCPTCQGKGWTKTQEG